MPGGSYDYDAERISGVTAAELALALADSVLLPDDSFGQQAVKIIAALHANRSRRIFARGSSATSHDS